MEAVEERLKMPTETLRFGEGTVQVTIIDNVIYVRVLHGYNDDMAIEMTRYLDKIIDHIPEKPIRIWDSSKLPAGSFKLSSQCVKFISDWSRGVKARKPGSRAYFIAKEPLIFGVSRMYQMQSSDEAMDVIVLKSIDELPHEIRSKIPS